MNFFRISRQIPENSDVCRFFNQICENKSEICRKFWILWKKFTIFLNYSLHSLLPPGLSSSSSASSTVSITGATCVWSNRIHRTVQLPFANLRRTRARLYRSRFCEYVLNARWKALDEIDQKYMSPLIYIHLHLSDPNKSADVRHEVWCFFSEVFNENRKML